MFDGVEIHGSKSQKKHQRTNTLFSEAMSEYLIGTEKCSF